MRFSIQPKTELSQTEQVQIILTLNQKLHLTVWPLRMTLESNIKVLRIMEMITN